MCAAIFFHVCCYFFIHVCCYFFHDTRVWTDARPHFPNYPHPPIGNLFAHIRKVFSHKYSSHVLISFATCRKILSCWLWISKQNWLSRPIQRAAQPCSRLPRGTSKKHAGKIQPSSFLSSKCYWKSIWYSEDEVAHSPRYTTFPRSFDANEDHHRLHVFA